MRVLQGWWRKQHAQRTAAAVTMQAAARRYLAVRRLDSSKRAATLVQVLFANLHYVICATVHKMSAWPSRMRFPLHLALTGGWCTLCGSQASQLLCHNVLSKLYN